MEPILSSVFVPAESFLTHGCRESLMQKLFAGGKMKKRALLLRLRATAFILDIKIFYLRFLSARRASRSSIGG